MQGVPLLDGMPMFSAMVRAVLTERLRYSNTAVEFPPLYIGNAPIYRGFPMLSLAGVRGRMRGGAREAVFARSLRSLACSGKVLPFSSRSVVVDALPMVARLPPHSAPFRSRPASACNRLSPAYRQAPIVVACGVRWRCRSGGTFAPSLSLVSLTLPPSLLAPLSVGFWSRSSRLGGSTELTCQVPRLVSTIPPCVSQSVAAIFRPSGRVFTAVHRPSLFGFCL